MKIGQLFLNFLWALLYLPVALPLTWLIPWAHKRANFERKNLHDPFSRPFKANIAFEVSSEGELEQIFPLLEYFLEKGKNIELIYSSESLEGKAQALALKYQSGLRIFRLPLITHFFCHTLGGQSLKTWISAPVLILCRYDFFPQLLSLKVKLGLVSASLKGKKRVNSNFYNLFDFIVCASPKEFYNFKKFYQGDLFELDLRIQRIRERLGKAEKKVSFIYPFLVSFPLNKRFIMGSCWPLEMEVFSHVGLQKDILDKKIQVVLAPHNLGSASVDRLVASFKAETDNKIPLYFMNEDFDALKLAAQMKTSPGVLIVTLKGILCELYTLFGNSFVGGGHGRSIHSVLEPYLANNRVYCGPKTFRSTEFDYILSHSPNYIHVVRKLGEFYDDYNKEPTQTDEFKKREDLLAQSGQEFSHVVGKINE